MWVLPCRCTCRQSMASSWWPYWVSWLWYALSLFCVIYGWLCFGSILLTCRRVHFPPVNLIYTHSIWNVTVSGFCMSYLLYCGSPLLSLVFQSCSYSNFSHNYDDCDNWTGTMVWLLKLGSLEHVGLTLRKHDSRIYSGKFYGKS